MRTVGESLIFLAFLASIFCFENPLRVQSYVSCMWEQAQGIPHWLIAATLSCSFYNRLNINSPFPGRKTDKQGWSHGF